MMRFLLLLFIPLFIFQSKAQELNAKVMVNSTQVNNNDRQLYKTFETAVSDFLNTRKWSNDQFMNQEKINCQFNIMIEERLSPTQFKASIQIQASRPVYNSGMNSALFLHSDKEFTFEYVEFQPLDFNDQAFTSNLTSLLGFYVYVILGMDYDSFSKLGGTKHFEKALQIVNSAQNARDAGWKSNEKNMNNRYWIINQIMNAQLASIRNATYQYHRDGLDNMYKQPDQARKAIIASLTDIQKAHRIRPANVFQQIWMNTKSEEIMKAFMGATPEDKTVILPILTEIDPNNINQYNRIK
jgi:hypothetical protein